MYDDILVPTDGSEPATEAVEHALDLAERAGATVHVLYVVSEAETVAIVGGAAVGELDRRRDEGEAVTQDAVERAAERGVDATSEIRPGTPHREIVRYAEDEGIDLVVMGTHGRSGVRRFLLGSVTERVTRLTDRPVLSVREEAR